METSPDAIFITDMHSDMVGDIPPQDEIVTSGFSIQCRITTEDPENNFIPDYGRITAYRGATGVAVERRPDDDQLGTIAAGDEDLVAVEDVMIPLPPRHRTDRLEVGPSRREVRAGSLDRGDAVQDAGRRDARSAPV